MTLDIGTSILHLKLVYILVSNFIIDSVMYVNCEPILS